MDWLEQKRARWKSFKRGLEAYKRDILPAACLQECRHHCCDLARTRLLAHRDEFPALLGREPERWEDYATDAPGFYRYSEGDCPRYDRTTRRCGIWDDPGRPAICGEFPFGATHDPRFSRMSLYVSPA